MAVESHAREEEREMNLQVKKESNYVSNASQKCQYASIARLHWQFQSKTLVQMLLTSKGTHQLQNEVEYTSQ